MNYFDKKIGIWDTYNRNFNPLVIEEEDEFRDMTLGDIYEILKRAETVKLGEVLGVKN